jgi:hypothetical protein
MDFISSLLSALLFVAFVPSFLFRIPRNGSFKTVLAVHAILFAIVSSLVMHYYWTNVKGYIENMSNYGDTCANGFTFGVNQKGEGDCIPVGHVTYDPSTASKTDSLSTK